MTPSRENLLAIVQRYYDSNDTSSTTELSPESKRREEVWAHWIANMAPWREFRAVLESALPDFLIGETYPSADGGPRCMVRLPRESRSPTSNWAVVGCVSLLAPVYFVYGVRYDYPDGRLRNQKATFEQPPSGMMLPAQVVARTIEKKLGLHALPREWAEIPVPLHSGLIQPPETTLFHALFTSDPGNIP